ncbi:MAG: SPOR domain-containing protein [Bacteroides sp.]|nr:SPOR domain-containing protein [Bacteroides sp.]
MIELSRHIEKLLLEHDCVIVPDLGGFVTHYTPAGRSEQENLFLPPCRTVGFNPLLRINDGLLVQSVMSVYDLSFSDASRLIGEEVNRMHAILLDTGKIQFGNIGELRCGMSGHYEFVPHDPDLLSPSLYGLDAFYMEEIIPEVKAKPVFTERTVVAHPSSSYTIHINRTFVRGMVASVAAVFMLLFFSPSVENTYIPEENYATLLPSSLLSQLNDYSLLFSPLALSETKTTREKEGTGPEEESEDVWQNVKPVAVKEIVVASSTENSEEQVQAMVRSEVPGNVSSPARVYHLIVSSLVHTKDAEAQVEELRIQGYESASVIVGDGKVRVSICSFKDRQEAYRQLALYREKQGFENAWLLIR